MGCRADTEREEALDGLRRVRRGGTFQVFGVAAAEAAGRLLAVPCSMGRAVELMASGAVDAASMITHWFALRDYPDALQAFRDGRGRKLKVRPGAQPEPPRTS